MRFFTNIYILLILTTTLCLSSCGNRNYFVSIYSDDADNKDSLLVKDCTLKVFIENSGSMNGYINRGSDLINDTYSYISELDHRMKKTEIYFVNSKLIPVSFTLDSFIERLPSIFNKTPGNTYNSEIVDMLSMVLSKTDDKTVSVFISDCILDPAKNANLYFSQCQTKMRGAFNSFLENNEDFAMQVFQLNSSFDGKLYPCGLSPVKTNHDRPYYVWIMGPSNIIGKLNRDNVQKFFRTGVKNKLSFIKRSSIPFVLQNSTHSFVNKPGEDLKVTESIPKFNLLYNPSSALIEDSCSILRKHYNLPPDKKIETCFIRITKNKKYSHCIQLKIKRPYNEIYSIDIPINRMPAWVKEISDNVGNDLERTCGFKYIVGGIEEAFSNIPSLEMKFKIKKQ